MTVDSRKQYLDVAVAQADGDKAAAGRNTPRGKRGCIAQVVVSTTKNYAGKSLKNCN
jgi:hypothetical protein